MSSRFKKNPVFDREIQLSPEFRATQVAAARAIVQLAERQAPRKSGGYRRSLRVVQSGDTVAAATTDIAGHLVEYGSTNNPVYAPLRRATRAAGLRLDESQQ